MKKIVVNLEDGLYNRLEKLSLSYRIEKDIFVEQAIKKTLPSFEENLSKIFVASEQDVTVKLEQRNNQFTETQPKPATLEIKLKPSHIFYGFLYIPKKYRDYFPEPTLDHIEERMFVLSTDQGDMKTHLEPAFRIPHITDWFKAHKTELKPESSIFIDVIEPFKKYLLKTESNSEEVNPQ